MYQNEFVTLGDRTIKLEADSREKNSNTSVLEEVEVLSVCTSRKPSLLLVYSSHVNLKEGFWELRCWKIGAILASESRRGNSLWHIYGLR